MSKRYNDIFLVIYVYGYTTERKFINHVPWTILTQNRLRVLHHLPGNEQSVAQPLTLPVWPAMGDAKPEETDQKQDGQTDTAQVTPAAGSSTEEKPKAPAARTFAEIAAEVTKTGAGATC